MKNEQTCFISTPTNIDVSALKSILKGLNVNANDIFDLSIGNSIQQNIKTIIKKSDFIIVIITEQSERTIYELGIAVGLGKPVFVLIDKEAKTSISLNNFIHLRVDINHLERLKDSIKKFTEEVSSNRSQFSYRSKLLNYSKIDEQLKIDYQRFYNYFLNNYNEVSEQYFDGVLNNLFNNLNLSFIKNDYKFTKNHKSTKDFRIDYAIWNEKLDSTIGNPILIEFKYGQLNHNDIVATEHKLKDALLNSEAEVGLLIYVDKDGKHFDYSYSLRPLILRFEFGDFINRLNKDNFESILIRRRNEIVHQGAK